MQQKRDEFRAIKVNMSLKQTRMFGWMIVLLLAPFAGAQQSGLPAAVPSTQQGSIFSSLPTQPIGPNDLIGISVYGSPELSRPVRVDGNGMVRLPMLQDPIKASGLMPSQLETAIADALKKGNVLVDPIVTVTIMEYQSRPVSVTGAVKNPLDFQLSQPTTLLQALTRAGGIADGAGPDILVTHTVVGPGGQPVQTTQTIPTRALIDTADPSLNLPLHAGDEILVPQARKVYVLGNVKTPGAYPVQETGDITVLRLLALAQGLTPYAYKKAYIYRHDGSGAKQDIPVQLAKIMKRKSPDVHLHPDDILYVPDSTGRRKAIIISAALGSAALFIIPFIFFY
ncbi:MAG: polysaccharide biosynthesis/export family protein [Acidobacteriaceae bacterium]